MRSGQVLRYLAIVGINLVIFYLLIRWCVENVQPARLSEQFARIPLAVAALAATLNLAAIAVYGLRLSILTSQRYRVSLPTALLGFGLNSILPFRLGELAKLYYAKRYFAIPASRLFAATLVEKLYDLSALALLAGLLVTLAATDVFGRSIAAALAVVVLAGFMVLLGYRTLAHQLAQGRHRGHRLYKLYFRVSRHRLLAQVLRATGAMSASARLQELFAALLEQSRLRHLARIVCCTALIWTINTTVVYAALSGFLPEHSIGVLDAIAVLLISALAIAIPTAPAGVGLFEAGVVAYLTRVCGVPTEPALAAAMSLHLATTSPALGLMIWIMLRSRRILNTEGAQA